MLSSAQDILSRIPYAYRIGRNVIRKYRCINGIPKLRDAVKLEPIRVVIGASGVYDEGWTPTEIEYLNITSERDWKRFFLPSTITAMLAEHVWEHLSPLEAMEGAKLCREYLKPGGYLRAAVPDGLHPEPFYIQHVKPGGTGPGAHDHQVLYTYHTFKDLFQNAGLRVQLLEYFDENGDFHFTEWKPSHGLIRRSKRFDNRNVDGRLNYTSLIIDAHKS